MTSENLAANIAAERERADLALEAAEKLLGLNLVYDAASRAYYAAFHYARALCLTRGEEPKSHGGVAHPLSLHFVKTGLLPQDTSRLFATLQRFRESSDYDAAFVLDSVGATQAVRDARELVERIREWLKQNAY